MKQLPFLCAVVILLAAGAARGETLDGLREGHPRLLAHTDDFDRIGELVATDEVAQRWYAQLRERAGEMLDQPVTKYDFRDGQRLLFESRDVEARVLTLGLLYRLEPDPRYVERIWADMQAAAEFPDWNPDHFLDVAEMAFAFAIAYDWLYDQWTPEQRATIRDALVRHAIRPALDAYDNGVWWTTTEINWNQVCNGGLLTSALAIADDEPELAAQMIELSVAALPISMARYAPDGGYEEGPGYWDYGTSFNVIAVAVLQSALGHDFGLGETEGFDVTGSFPIQMTGPTGLLFNFADAHEGGFSAPALFYLAKRYQQPMYAQYAVEHNRGEPLDLLWYDPALLDLPVDALPLTMHYESADAVVMRTSWDDPGALFVAAKAGRIGEGHGQFDLGSFILEAQGVRWIIDLGRDDYNLPGYFNQAPDGQRWTYYRIRAEGHNTLVFDPDGGLDQPLDATATLDVNPNTALIGLTHTYGRPVVRRITLDPDADSVQIVDTIGGDSEAEVWWFAHTRAKVELRNDDRTALLEQDGKRMVVELIDPADAHFTVMDARPLPTSPDPPGQNPNNGAELENRSAGASLVRRGDLPTYGEPDPDRAIRKLAIHLPGVTQQTISVRFTAETPAPAESR